jgi:hypothetical protein
MMSGNPKELAGMLETLAEAELTLAEFYMGCAQKWEEDREFWVKIGHEEVKHSNGWRSLASIVAKRPHCFSMGRPCNAASLEGVIADMRSRIGDLRSGSLPKSQTLRVARDLEQSPIEFGHSEIVSTTDKEYQTASEALVNGPEAHKARIERKMVGEL